MELTRKATRKKVEALVAGIRRPAFIERIEFLPCSVPGDPAIDFFHAGAKFALLRVKKGYRSVYDNEDIAKLVHCFCNQQLVSRLNELAFYAKRLNAHGIKVASPLLKSGSVPVRNVPPG
jgi:hypothetical protein